MSADPIFLSEKCDSGVPNLDALRADAEAHAHARTALIRKRHPHLTPEEQAWELLTLSRYRRGPKALTETAKERSLAQIRETVRRDLELTFTLCFLPAKIRHPLKTFARDGTEVDMGEAGAILRLHELATGLSDLLHRPARATVSSDGMRYAHCMGVTSQTVRGYQRNVRLLIEALGVQNTVTIVDEATLLPLTWSDDVAAETVRVRNQIAAGDEATVTEVTKLQPAVALCIDVDPSTSLSDLILAHAEDLSRDERRSKHPSAADLREELELRGLEATIGYVAANRAMARIQLFRHCWPLTLKGTVHPKPGEIGLLPVNEATDNVFPYHGQGHSRLGVPIRDKVDDIRVSFVIDLLRLEQVDRLRGIMLPPDQFPFSNGLHPFGIIAKDG